MSDITNYSKQFEIILDSKQQKVLLIAYKKENNVTTYTLEIPLIDIDTDNMSEVLWDIQKLLK